MKQKHRTGTSILFLVLLVLIISSPVRAAETHKPSDVWTWTKKNLSPTWMEWGERYWPTKPVRGGYFRRASVNYVGLLNPNRWPVLDWGVINLFYEGLAAYDGQYRQTSPWLMESWEFHDPRTLIMKLKPGIKFHDGTVFNANSLKYLFDWISDPANGCWTRAQHRIFQSLEIVDEYTLRWRTHEAWGNFPAGFFSFQISQKALEGDVLIREAQRASGKAARLRRIARASGKEKDEEAAAKAEEEEKILAEKTRGLKSTDLYPVGTGPYLLEEAEPGNYIQAKRNPNWWFGQSVGRPEMPYFDGIRVIVIPDPSIQLANLRAGQIDQMNLNKNQYRLLKDHPDFNIYVHPTNTLVYLMVNHSREPGKDIRIRKAIAHAIDRQALIIGTQFSLAREASCFYPDDHWAHNPNLKPVAYDPELSKTLLSEAGYSKGLKISGTMGNDPNSMTIALAIQNMLAEAGIDWTAEALDAVAMTDRWRNLEFDLALSIWPHIQDPFVLSRLYHPEGSWNFGRVHDEKLVQLLDAGQREIDQEKRKEIYQKIEEIIYRNYEDIWLWWEITAIAFSKNVQGWNNRMYLENRTWYQNSHPLWFKEGHP